MAEKAEPKLNTAAAEETARRAFFETSVLREGLLNWYPFKSGAAILDAGCGSGALTGLLLRRAARVTAVDRDPEAVADLKRRYAEAVNEGKLTVICADIKDVAAEGLVKTDRFDYIAAAGLLDGGCDAAGVLAALRRLLKEDGTLLLAWRNRFGLKYFCGGTDDLIKEPFEHLTGRGGALSDGRFGNPSPLFSRAGMEAVLKEAGFAPVRYYYPLPDGFYTQAVLTDEWPVRESVRDRVVPYDPYQSPVLLPEADVLDTVIREGMLPQMADTFLAECRRGSADKERHVIYAALSTDREETNAFVTAVFSDGTAEKRALYPEGEETLRRICDSARRLEMRGLRVVPQTLTDGAIRMPAMAEEPLLAVIRGQMALPHEEAAASVTALFEMLWRNILRSSDEVEIRDEEALTRWGVRADALGPVLKDAYIDMIPYNAFMGGTDVIYYDQEFVRERFPAKYTLFRALRYTWLHIAEAEKAVPLAYMKERFGLTHLWDRFQEEEDRFVSANRHIEKHGDFYRWAEVDRKAAGRRRLGLRADGPAGEERRLLKKIHACQLDLLKTFDKVCREKGLRYMAVHGTLLGAVRHGGFIPWDDDLDLAMPREDYDKLASLGTEVFGRPYFLQTTLNDPGTFNGGYMRLRDDRTTAVEQKDRWKNAHLGIWIDILPLDACPEDEEGLARRQKKIRYAQRLLYAKTYKLDRVPILDTGGIRISWYYLARQLYSRERLAEKLERACRSDEMSSRCGILACYYGRKPNRNVYDAAEAADLVELPFEDTVIPVPRAYDKWLAARYGQDYMTWPAPADRYRHGTVWFDPEAPYYGNHYEDGDTEESYGG